MKTSARRLGTTGLKRGDLDPAYAGSSDRSNGDYGFVYSFDRE
ncbi:hypothetical protein [Haladaptatus paucihalophilus]|nr:hypothetical protein [Haladaptatus paucihalophilus]